MSLATGLRLLRRSCRVEADRTAEVCRWLRFHGATGVAPSFEATRTILQTRTGRTVIASNGELRLVGVDFNGRRIPFGSVIIRVGYGEFRCQI